MLLCIQTRQTLGKNSIMYEFKGKALYDKIPFVLDMMKEIMYNTKFTDYKRLKEIIARIRSRFEATMSGSGHSIAMLEGCAQFSASAYYSDMLKGGIRHISLSESLMKHLIIIRKI